MTIKYLDKQAPFVLCLSFIFVLCLFSKCRKSKTQDENYYRELGK